MIAGDHNADPLGESVAFEVGFSLCATTNSTQKPAKHTSRYKEMPPRVSSSTSLMATPTRLLLCLLGAGCCWPADGSAYKHAIQQLLGCCNITAEFTPVSDGGKEAGNKRPTDR